MMKRTLSLLLLLVFVSSCSKGKSTSTLAPFTSEKITILNPVGSNFEVVDCATMNSGQDNQAGQPQATQESQTPVFDNNNGDDNGTRQCGYLTVPEDRRLPNGTTIKIAVTIFMSSSTARQPDPLVIVGSGNSLGRGGYFGPPGAFDQMVPNRDVIMVDMRGTGRSQPAYSCSQFSDLSDKMASENLSLAQWETAYIEATRACRTQLESAGANLSAYTSAAIAADLEDLRQALGYSQWNVYASSYSTRIALSLMRDYPQSLRSVVLDSPWPLQVNTSAEQAVSAEQVLDTVFRYCEEDEQCNKYYPKLKDYLYEDVDTLNAHPITVHTANLNSGALLDIVVDGNKLLDFMLSSVSSYRMDQLNQVPRMIYQLHDGKVEVISQLLGQSNGSTRFNGGVDQLIQCNDDASSGFSTTTIANNPNVDIRIQKYFETIADANSKACDVWNTGNSAVSNNATVSSNVSTLLLASELNWRIPASWASLTAQTLSHAYTVEFAGMGQSISSARGVSGCSNGIVEAFLTNPNVQPDTQCASAKPNFIWITLP